MTSYNYGSISLKKNGGMPIKNFMIDKYSFSQFVTLIKDDGELMKERMKLIFKTVVVIFSLLIVFSCSDDNSTKPSSDIFTQTISANQETVVIYEEIMLNFAAGSVSESFELKIKELEDVENISFSEYELIGDVYQINHNEDVVLNKPVSVSIDFESDDAIDPSNVFIGRYLDGEWTKLLTSYDEESESLNAMTDQLCWFAPFWSEEDEESEVAEITEVVVIPEKYTGVSLSLESFTEDIIVDASYNDSTNVVTSAQISISMLGEIIDESQDLGTLLSSIAGDYEIISLPYAADNMTNSIILEMKEVTPSYQYIMDKTALGNLYQSVEGFDTLVFTVQLLDENDNILDSQEERVEFYIQNIAPIFIISPNEFASVRPTIVWGFLDVDYANPEDYIQEKYRLVIDHSEDPFNATNPDYELTVNLSDLSITDSFYEIAHQVEEDLVMGDTYYFQVKVSKNGSFEGNRVLSTFVKSFTVVGDVIDDTEDPVIDNNLLPEPNSTISGDVTLGAYATDNVQVYQVKFTISTSAIEPTVLGTATTPDENNLFSFTFDSTQYSNGNHTFSATAYDTSGNYYTVYWYLYIDNTTSGDNKVANPVLTPGAGNYDAAQVVTITCETDNAGIYYTLDGSTPTQESATVYWTPFIISEDTTVKVRAFRTDFEPSDIVTAVYNIENNTQPGGMVLVPAGTFTMGDTSEGIYDEELPTHQVTLDAFYISKYEQTYTKFVEFLNSYDITSWGSYQGKQLIDLNGAYSAFRYSNGTFYYDSNDAAPDIECPVMEVNWYGAVVFSNWLSEEEGLTPCYDTSDWSCDMTANGYRLPTEAEWEYAARGASNQPDFLYSGSNFPGDVAWQSQNNDVYGTKVVGTRDPNSLGIYDMSGNVFEWCNDFYGEYSAEAQTNPTGPDSSMTRVVRGGSWNTHFSQCRVSYRGNETPVLTEGNVGFRLVRNAE